MENKTTEWICANLIILNDATKAAIKDMAKNRRAIKIGFLATICVAAMSYIHEKRILDLEQRNTELEEKVKRVFNELSYLKGADDLNA